MMQRVEEEKKADSFELTCEVHPANHPRIRLELMELQQQFRQLVVITVLVLPLCDCMIDSASHSSVGPTTTDPCFHPKNAVGRSAHSKR